MHKKIILKTRTIGFVLLCILVTSLILVFPNESFQAAYSGLNTWLRIVFPALLPFLIASEIMVGTGFVDFIAVLLHPLMQPLFGCPGESSFIWAMSITSGYPVGAKLVSSFLEQKKITTTEGQRIITFCSTSGPLFMIGAVGIGMLGSPEAGRIIAVSHYTASLLMGLIFRFYNPTTAKRSNRLQPNRFHEKTNFKTALQMLLSARQKDNRTLGELIGDAIRHSMNTLFYIGGFIMLFSVIINILIRIGFIDGLSKILALMLLPLGLKTDLLKGVASGLFEMTIGCKLTSQATAPLFQKILVNSFIISWSGFSIHSQVAGLISKANISISMYLIAKSFHGVLASIIAWGIIQLRPNPDFEVFRSFDTPWDTSWSTYFQDSWQLLFFCISILLGTAVILNIILNIKRVFRGKE